MSPIKERPPFDFEVFDFSGGLNAGMSRMGIANNEMALGSFNLQPVGRELKTVPGYDSPANPFNIGHTVVAGIDMGGYHLVVDDTGKLWKSTVGVLAELATGFSSAAAFSVWQGTTALITDPTKGYCSYDGTTFVVIDATAVGKNTCIEVFKNRVFMATGKTIRWTAPGTHNDFNVANGAGSTPDNYSTLSTIMALRATTDMMYIVGDYGTHIVAGLQTLDDATTVFQVIESLPNVGTPWPNTAKMYGSNLYLMNPAGLYIISGSSFTHIHEQIYPILAGISAVPMSFFSEINGASCYCFSCYLTNPLDASLSQSWILCFDGARWFPINFEDLDSDATYSITAVWQNKVSSSQKLKAYAAATLLSNSTLPELWSIFKAGTKTARRRLRTKAFPVNSMIKDKTVSRVGAMLGNVDSPASAVSPKITILADISSDQISLQAQSQFYTEHNDLNNGVSDIFYSAGCEARGKTIAFQYDEVSLRTYNLTALMAELKEGAPW